VGDHENRGGDPPHGAHTGLETFAEDDPAFTRESCQGGWDSFTGRLKRFVETGKP
jgi:hypothetical protein